MTKRRIVCAVYTRKSSEEGLAQEFNSLDAQREACEAYIKSQTAEGWRVAPERFDDGGVSGGTMERPALKRLIDQVKAGRVQVIIVYKIDRLTRSLADFARLVEILDQHDASFVSVTQQFNTTSSMGRLTLNVLLSFAQFEREVTSERIRDKVAASKRKGMWMGGYPPLGYDIVDRKLHKNECEAEAVKRIFSLAKEMETLTALEQQLKREGVKAKRWRSKRGKMTGGGALTRTNLRRLLSNPVYIGKIRQAGELFDDKHEAIISDPLWSVVQLKMEELHQKKRASRNGKANALLAGRLFDDAGNRMVPSHARRSGAIYHYYVSTPLIRGDKESPGTLPRVSAPKIEAEVIAALRAEQLAPTGSPDDKFIETVQKIVVYADRLEVEVEMHDGKTRLFTVPTNLRSGKSADRLIDAAGANHRNEALIKSLALAHDWRSALEAGAYASVTALAKAKSYSERYVWKILRLAYLAPDIIDGILDGQQPASLNLHTINKTALSGDWRLQRRSLGFAEKS